MKLTLVIIAAIVGAILVTGIMVFIKGISGALSLPLLGLSIGFLSRAGKLEERVKLLSCATPDLKCRYQAINRAWKEKAWPDF